MFKDEDETGQPRINEAERLRKKIIRLKQLAHKYKHAEIIQNALLEISNIATHASSLEEFYVGVHSHLKQLIPADNFLFQPSMSALASLLSLFSPMRKMRILRSFILNNPYQHYYSRD